MFDLSAILNYPIQLVVQSWHSAEPLRWFSRNDDGIVAEGRFLEAPGLPLFTLEDEMGRRVSDGIPEDVLAVTRLMPAMDFELAQACAASEAARELAENSLRYSPGNLRMSPDRWLSLNFCNYSGTTRTCT